MLQQCKNNYETKEGWGLTGILHQFQSEKLQSGITSSSLLLPPSGLSPPTNDFLPSVWHPLFVSWQSPYARVTFAAKAILSHFR